MCPLHRLSTRQGLRWPASCLWWVSHTAPGRGQGRQPRRKPAPEEQHPSASHPGSPAGTWHRAAQRAPGSGHLAPGGPRLRCFTLSPAGPAPGSGMPTHSEGPRLRLRWGGGGLEEQDRGAGVGWDAVGLMLH